jgi:hypothetical protein
LSIVIPPFPCGCHTAIHHHALPGHIADRTEVDDQTCLFCLHPLCHGLCGREIGLEVDAKQLVPFRRVVTKVFENFLAEFFEKFAACINGFSD